MSLMIVAIIIVVLWVGAFGYYWIVSSQQVELEEKIGRLQNTLDQHNPT